MFKLIARVEKEPEWLANKTKEQKKAYFDKYPGSKYNPNRKEKQKETDVPKVKKNKTIKPITSTKAFKAWFAGSKVRKDGKPIVVYHGSPESSKLSQFKDNPENRGEDALGSGFYFTSSPSDASGYTEYKDRFANDTRESSGGVTPVFLNIQKPIRLKPNESIDDKLKLRSDSSVAKLMALSHKLYGYDDSPLWNFFDLNPYKDKEIPLYKLEQLAHDYDYRNSLTMLESDFFSDYPLDFRKRIKRFTGYDGVIKELPTGDTHYVAWFPNQIKSAIGNSTFNPDSDDITAKLIGER